MTTLPGANFNSGQLKRPKASASRAKRRAERAERIFALAYNSRYDGFESLATASRPLATLAKVFDEFLFELDADGRFLGMWSSRQPLEIGRRTDFIGRHAMEVLGEDVFLPFSEVLHRVIATHQADGIEFPVDLEDGRHWFYARVLPVGRTLGKRPSVSLLAHDITAQKPGFAGASRTARQHGKLGSGCEFGDSFVLRQSLSHSRRRLPKIRDRTSKHRAERPSRRCRRGSDADASGGSARHTLRARFSMHFVRWTAPSPRSRVSSSRLRRPHRPRGRSDRRRHRPPERRGAAGARVRPGAHFARRRASPHGTRFDRNRFAGNGCAENVTRAHGRHTAKAQHRGQEIPAIRARVC